MRAIAYFLVFARHLVLDVVQCALDSQDWVHVTVDVGVSLAEAAFSRASRTLRVHLRQQVDVSGTAKALE